MTDYRCPYEHGRCKAPSTDCPHWQGTFCELDIWAVGIWKPKGDECKDD